MSGGRVRAGGAFTTLGGLPRNFIGAVDAPRALPWDVIPGPTTRSRVAVDGNSVYAGGAFTNAGGAARNRIAALDVTTGAATAWDPSASNAVYSLAVSNGTVLAGGAFTNIGGAGRNRTLRSTRAMALPPIGTPMRTTW